MSDAARLSDRTDPTGGDLRRRLIAARSLAEVAGDRLEPGQRAQLGTILQRAKGRLSVAGSHTVVALAGPTGVGKSSLFNALLGVDLADVGVTRPTTDVPLAGVVSADPVAELMDHLGLDTWHHVAVSTHPELDSLVLVDLPDHDSVVTAHRQRAAAMVAVADRLLWVVDPEKYADASVHQDLLQPLHAHGGVLTVVLNRSDRLDPVSRDRVLGDLRRLLDEAGLGGAEVLATSREDADSIDRLRTRLAASVADHREAGNRIIADLRGLGATLVDAVPPDGGAARSRQRHDDVVEAAMVAAGGPAILDAVAGTHRHRARRATGWPLLRRLQARGRNPLARLGLGRAPRDRGEVGAPTSRPAPHGVAVATLSTAVHDRVTDLTEGWPPRWSDPLEDRLDQVVVELPGRLDRAVAGADLEQDRVPGWWVAVGALQWLLATATLVGAVWLLAAFVISWLQLPDLPMPGLGAVPWPTVLLLGGALGGVAVGAVSALVARAGAVRARGRARTHLRERIEIVVEDSIVQVLEAEGARAAAARDHLDRMRK